MIKSLRLLPPEKKKKKKKKKRKIPKTFCSHLNQNFIITMAIIQHNFISCPSSMLKKTNEFNLKQEHLHHF
jgi:hypothetical protein